jgi:hypothetical protein
MHPVAIASRFLLGIAAALTIIAMVEPSPASAHERREVGKYLVVVGFNDEPALQGEPNGAQITISVPSEGDRRVEGLADSLRVSVAAGGGQPREFPLRAVFGQPGRYVADFIPTRPGVYIFSFSGSIEGTSINERFESGPGRFDEVTAVESMQFPEAVPPGNEVARIARGANERAAAAEDRAEDARRLAVASLAVGALGIFVALGAVGLLVARRPASVASRAS